MNGEFEFRYAGPCAECGCGVMLPKSLYDAAIRSTEIGFFCAYGHGLHFTAEAARYRRQQQLPDNVAKLHLVKNEDEKPA